MKLQEMLFSDAASVLKLLDGGPSGDMWCLFWLFSPPLSPNKEEEHEEG